MKEKEDIKTKENSIHTLTIIGQIEGHFSSEQNQKSTKYEQLVPLIVALEQSEDVKGVLIILNTMGGDVEAGLGLAEMIASMKKPTVSLIIGGSHSIGVPIAVAAKRSVITPSATMTLHPVRMTGLVVGAPQTYNYFSDMQKRIVNFICRHSHATAESINEMMMRPDMLATDVGTVLEATEATACGLIDQMGGLSDALSELEKMINTPN
jgi:ATP-dependent protease ClpP protease subunit